MHTCSAKAYEEGRGPRYFTTFVSANGEQLQKVADLIEQVLRTALFGERIMCYCLRAAVAV